MKKKDLKKLALLGIAGGLIVVSQGNLQAETQAGENTPDIIANLIAAGCGNHGCNTYSGCGSNTRGGGHKCNSNSGCGSSRSTSSGCGSRASGCGSRASGCGSRAVIADADEGFKNQKDSGQLMTEDQLMSQLNDQGKQMYMGLNPEGKAMAIKLASKSCKGNNDCKGQNSCKTSMNSCAGKGNCAGTSDCSFKDKNLAVKVAAHNQAAKRAQTNSGMYQPSAGQTNRGSY